MLDYSIFRKSFVSLEDVAGLGPWDTFISAFTLSDRVRQVYSRVRAERKHWLVFPDYAIPAVLTPREEAYEAADRDEDVYIGDFLRRSPVSGSRVCVDTTGFLRPHLLFLLRELISLPQLEVVDFLYSEPGYYIKKEQTVFAGEAVDNVRPVRGFEGSKNPGAEEVLIIGAGYDPHLISIACLRKPSAKKILLVGFPPLRPEMYQESVLQINCAAEETRVDLKAEDAMHFVPAHDPFVTAEVLHRIVADVRASRGKDVNIYLCPLATKAQALGFGIFFECELARSSASILFPFSSSYSPETSKGIGRVWRFEVETKAIRALGGH